MQFAVCLEHKASDKPERRPAPELTHAYGSAGALKKVSAGIFLEARFRSTDWAPRRPMRGADARHAHVDRVQLLRLRYRAGR